MTEPLKFTRYQVFVVAVLAFLQFTIILDFMILSPIGAVLMPALSITPQQFGVVVSVYAFSAGISGFLASGFADRFDRKRLLLFFYSGFVLGTLLCALAQTFDFLIFARIVTGIFGGVLGSIVFAIMTDLFPMQMRGRVMGFIGTAFSASQVLGIPLGLYLSSRWDWHASFYMIVGVSTVVGVAIVIYLKPIDAHLALQTRRNPFRHLLATVSKPRYLQAFATTALLSTGGFMLMPFGSDFSVHNLGLTLDQLPFVYMVTGVASMITGPFVGRLSDKVGKFRTFMFGSMLSIIMVVIYTHLGVTPLPMVIGISILMFVGISSRMIPAQALMSAVPEPENRGAFMSVSSSIQQISGGLASVLAGYIVVKQPDGLLDHFDTLGYVVASATVFTVFMMYRIQKLVQS